MKRSSAFLVLATTTLLLSGCNKKSSTSWSSFSYGSYCQADSPFSFDAGTAFSDFVKNFAGAKVTYSKTKDTSIVSKKVYYTYGIDKIYRPVANPVASGLSAYYEKGDETAIQAVFTAAASADIYPNKLVYSYLNKLDLGVAGKLDWHSNDEKENDFTETRSKNITRYQGPNSLMLDGTVAYALDSYEDYAKDANFVIVNRSKSGNYQMSRDGYCELKDNINEAYSFNQAELKVAGTSKTTTPSSYNYKINTKYTHSLYQADLALGFTKGFMSYFSSTLAAAGDYGDATESGLPNQDGSFFSYQASSLPASEGQGIEIALHLCKQYTDDKNTTATTDDEVIRYLIDVVYQAKNGSISSFSYDAKTTSSIGGAATRTLKEQNENYSYSFESSISEFSGNKIDLTNLPIKSTEDFAF